MIDLERTPAGSPKAQERAAAVVLFALACCGGVGRVVAQAPQESVRTVEPRFTRIFGSDSMQLGQPAMSADGRWVVFSKEDGPQAYNLWVVSTAGGDPIRLTSGRYSDARPVWLPSGDRIVFTSDRPSSREYPENYVMTIPLDPRTGRPTGPPRQVSLEPALGSGWPTVSPDGNHVAYITRRDSIRRIVVIPSTGGASRNLVEYGGSVASVTTPQWSADGAWVYYFVRPQGQAMRTMMRVRAGGGMPQELGRFAPSNWPYAHISRDARHHLIRIPQGPGSEPLYEVATPDGRTVARFAVHRNMMVGPFTPDGRGFVAQQSNTVAPIRVVPVSGGPVRQLTEAREYDWPAGWSRDGARVFLRTRANGHGVLMAVSIDDGTATEWRTPDEARGDVTLSGDERHLLYGTGTDFATEGESLLVRRLEDGRTRRLSASRIRVPGLGAIGGGGHYNMSALGEVLYFERRDNRLELFAAAPEGRPRLLRAFPTSLAGRGWIGVHGDRFAWSERGGDSSTLYIAEGRNGQVRRVVTVAGSLDSPTWSNSGRWIALNHYLTNQPHGVALVGVGPNGTPTAPARILPSGAMWAWQIQWLPNDEAVTILGMTGAGSETHVYLVSLREGERPVAITRDDPSIKWGYELSPDGRYVAYPAEISRGSSIWRLDLGDVLAGAGREGSRRRQ